MYYITIIMPAMNWNEQYSTFLCDDKAYTTYDVKCVTMHGGVDKKWTHDDIMCLYH